MPRRGALGALSALYAGFVLLVFISQLSTRLLEQALSGSAAVGGAQTLAIGQTSSELAYTASALGLAFSAAVIFTVRRRLDPELGVYRAMGIPIASSLRIVLLSHPVYPVAAALISGAVLGAADALLGLDALVPVALAVAFATTLLIWLVFHTVTTVSRQEMGRGVAGRAG